MKRVLVAALALALVACASTSPQVRRQHADDLVAKRGWDRLNLPAGSFVLAAFAPSPANTATASVDTLTVYIEGDGFAWRSRRQPSDDPTPLNPVALELALKHVPANATEAVAYLARPCQYVSNADARNCDEPYWTTRRFAGEVIDASNTAIDALKNRYRARTLVLVGYSGGGAVAALVAARRSDVVRLVTVAATLDHRAWTTLHKVTPLDGSLNPAEAWSKLQDIPQLHFVGAKDTIVPVTVAEAYSARFPLSKRPKVQVVTDFDHICCWPERWPSLAAQAFPKSP